MWPRGSVGAGPETRPWLPVVTVSSAVVSAIAVSAVAVSSGGGGVSAGITGMGGW